MSFDLTDEIYGDNEKRILEEARKTKEYAAGVAQGVIDYERGIRLDSTMAELHAKKYNEAGQRVNYELGWTEGWWQAESMDCTTKQFNPDED